MLSEIFHYFSFFLLSLLPSFLPFSFTLSLFIFLSEYRHLYTHIIIPTYIYQVAKMGLFLPHFCVNTTDITSQSECQALTWLTLRLVLYQFLRGVLKSPTIIVNISISLFSCISLTLHVFWSFVRCICIYDLCWIDSFIILWFPF